MRFVVQGRQHVGCKRRSRNQIPTAVRPCRLPSIVIRLLGHHVQGSDQSCSPRVAVRAFHAADSAAILFANNTVDLLLINSCRRVLGTLRSLRLPCRRSVKLSSGACLKQILSLFLLPAGVPAGQCSVMNIHLLLVMANGLIRGVEFA